MKFDITNRLIMIAIIALTANPFSAFAQSGNRGGGDACKNEIDKNRSEILRWINSGDAADLNFKIARVPGWSFGDAPVTGKSYKKAMEQVLEEGKIIVTCYLDPARIKDPEARKIAENEGVTYKKITIGDPPEPTTCINYEDENNVSHIDCDYDKVLASTGDHDYVTTHHEFASIAGVELRTNTYVSDFSVSNQVGEHAEWKLVKFLGKARLKINEPPSLPGRAELEFQEVRGGLNQAHEEGCEPYASAYCHTTFGGLGQNDPRVYIHTVGSVADVIANGDGSFAIVDQSGLAKCEVNREFLIRLGMDGSQFKAMVLSPNLKKVICVDHRNKGDVNRHFFEPLPDGSRSNTVNAVPHAKGLDDTGIGGGLEFDFILGQTVDVVIQGFEPTRLHQDAKIDFGYSVGPFPATGLYLYADFKDRTGPYGYTVATTPVGPIAIDLKRITKEGWKTSDLLERLFQGGTMTCPDQDCYKSLEFVPQ